MTDDKPIKINEADVRSLSDRLQQLHSQLPTSERVVFEELLRDSMIMATPHGLVVYHLSPPPPPWQRRQVKHHGGSGGIVGGADGFTVVIGADGHIHILKPVPDGPIGTQR